RAPRSGKSSMRMRDAVAGWEWPQRCAVRALACVGPAHARGPRLAAAASPGPPWCCAWPWSHGGPPVKAAVNAPQRGGGWGEGDGERDVGRTGEQELCGEVDV
ncbi:UNVERIFIED_CONTAM: hypothetical protein DV099_10630, partial [Bifidobacterium longum]|nr:hypothetical protein [Bifidobacterium longum]